MELVLNTVKIRPNWNVRDTDLEVESLASSMDKNGQLHPIIVNENNELLAGHRRLAAAKLLGWEKIEAKGVFDLTPEFERLVHLDENLERKDLSIPKREQALAEKCQLYKKLVEAGVKNPGDFRKETEDQTGLSKTAIYRGVQRHDNASDMTWNAYTSDEIGGVQLDELIKLPKLVQDKILVKIVGASFAETRHLVNEELAKINIPAEFSVKHGTLGTIHVDKFFKLFCTSFDKVLELMDCLDPEFDVQNKLSPDQWRKVEANLSGLKQEVQLYV